jgi:hypothetical protein
MGAVKRVSTCGSTNPVNHCYETHFEDDFGVIQTNYIVRPHLLQWVIIIDEHDQQRQSLLHLERSG